MTTKELIKEIARVLDDKKAVDIKVIRIAELTIIADYFILASGTSITHTKALAGDLEEALSKKGVEPNHIEGRATGWTLLDYNPVIVHIFDKASREYYNLERLWVDAAVMDISEFLKDQGEE